jgi:replicative DNA helicase
MSSPKPLRQLKHDAIDRIPPQNLDAEKSLLGGILLSNDALERALDIVSADDFYRAANSHIFEAICDLHERREPVDLLTLSNALQARGLLEQVGGRSYLVELTEVVPTAANTEYYARIVVEKSVLRKIIDTSTEMAGRAFTGEETPDELLSDAERNIMAIAKGNIQKRLTSVEDVLPDAILQLNQLFDSRGAVTGLATGFSELDKMTSGFQPGNLIILAARPGMGKTSLVLNLAAHAAIHEQKAIAFFSLEMGKEELVQRLLCAEAGIDMSELRRGTMAANNWEKLTRAASSLSNTDLYFDDNGGIDIRYVVGKCRRQKAEGKLDLVIIDYLQLMNGHKKTERREQEISEISRGLKAMAKDLKVPVIALSQLNRGLEGRPDKRPMMSDLRESGAIEQDADMIGFIYRHEVYAQKEGKGDEVEPNKAELIIGKNRHGPTGIIPLTFIAKFTRFSDYLPSNAYGGEPVWGE